MSNVIIEKQILKKLSRFTSNSKTNYHLQGFYVDSENFVATDSFRMCIYKHNLDIPEKFLKKIYELPEKIENKNYLLSDLKTIDGQYVNYHVYIKRSKNKGLTAILDWQPNTHLVETLRAYASAGKILGLRTLFLKAKKALNGKRYIDACLAEKYEKSANLYYLNTNIICEQITKDFDFKVNINYLYDCFRECKKYTYKIYFYENSLVKIQLGRGYTDYVMGMRL